MIDFPLPRCSRRIRPIVSTMSIPHRPLRAKAGSRPNRKSGGSNFGRRSTQGVNFARRNTRRMSVQVDLTRCGAFITPAPASRIKRSPLVGSMGAPEPAAGQGDRPYGGGSRADGIDLPGAGRPLLKALRSPAGEEMVLQQNIFIEQVLNRATIRALTPEEAEHYRRPFLEPGEGRRPTLSFPRNLPLDGEPPDTVTTIAEFGELDGAQRRSSEAVHPRRARHAHAWARARGGASMAKPDRGRRQGRQAPSGGQPRRDRERGRRLCQAPSASWIIPQMETLSARTTAAFPGPKPPGCNGICRPGFLNDASP